MNKIVLQHNFYRFTSGADTTDEMLSTIMKEVAQEAKEKKGKDN